MKTCSATSLGVVAGSDKKPTGDKKSDDKKPAEKKPPEKK